MCIALFIYQESLYLSYQNLNNFLQSRVIQNLHHVKTEPKGFWFYFFLSFLFFICIYFNLFCYLDQTHTYLSLIQGTRISHLCDTSECQIKRQVRVLQMASYICIVTAIFLSSRSHWILFAMWLKCVSLSSLARNSPRPFSKECTLTHQNIKIPPRKRKSDKELCVCVCVYSQHIQRGIIGTVSWR